jgi:hypothetical protein
MARPFPTIFVHFSPFSPFPAGTGNGDAGVLGCFPPGGLGIADFYF